VETVPCGPAPPFPCRGADCEEEPPDEVPRPLEDDPARDACARVPRAPRGGSAVRRGEDLHLQHPELARLRLVLPAGRLPARHGRHRRGPHHRPGDTEPDRRGPVAERDQYERAGRVLVHAVRERERHRQRPFLQGGGLRLDLPRADSHDGPGDVGLSPRPRRLRFVGRRDHDPLDAPQGGLGLERPGNAPHADDHDQELPERVPPGRVLHSRRGLQHPRLERGRLSDDGRLADEQRRPHSRSDQSPRHLARQLQLPRRPHAGDDGGNGRDGRSLRPASDLVQPGRR